MIFTSSYVRLSGARKTSACMSLSHFQVMPIGFPPTCDSDGIHTEQEQESKRAEGENTAAEDNRFDIKRMLSQQRRPVSPRHRSAARRSERDKAETLSKSCSYCLLNKGVGERRLEHTLHCCQMERRRFLLTHEMFLPNAVNTSIRVFEKKDFERLALDAGTIKVIIWSCYFMVDTAHFCDVQRSA